MMSDNLYPMNISELKAKEAMLKIKEQRYHELNDIISNEKLNKERAEAQKQKFEYSLLHKKENSEFLEKTRPMIYNKKWKIEENINNKHTLNQIRLVGNNRYWDKMTDINDNEAVIKSYITDLDKSLEVVEDTEGLKLTKKNWNAEVFLTQSLENSFLENKDDSEIAEDDDEIESLNVSSIPAPPEETPRQINPEEEKPKKLSPKKKAEKVVEEQEPSQIPSVAEPKIEEKPPTPTWDPCPPDYEFPNYAIKSKEVEVKKWLLKNHTGMEEYNYK